MGGGVAGRSFEAARPQILTSAAGLSRGSTDRIVIVVGINNHPRNPQALNFETRQIAAHKAGRWLTDELNLYAETSQSGTHNFQCPNGCHPPPPTPPPASYHYGPGTYKYVAVRGTLSQTSPWDFEDDYPDGTSSLTGSYSNGANDVTMVFEPNGTADGYSWNNSATPAPNPTDPNSYLDDWSISDSGCTFGGNGINCAGNLFTHKIFWCSMLVGSGGFGAKYAALLLLKSGKAGADAASVLVGASLAVLCK